MIVTYHGIVVFDISRQMFDIAYCGVATILIISCSFIIVRAMRT